MLDLRVLLAFLAVCVLALAYAGLGVKAALAPFCAVGTLALVLALFGALGALWAGGLAAYLLCAAALGFVVWRYAIQKAKPPALGVGFWFFVAAGLAMLLLLRLRQPVFTGWDEFSLWGTAGKLMKLYDQLYTTAPVGWVWTPGQSPVYIVFTYFFQFWGKGFVEWHSYAACNILMLAAMAAVLAPFEGKAKGAALPMAVVLLLCPFVFLHYQQLSALSPAYIDTMVDTALGLAFGACLAAFYAGRQRRLAGLWPLCLMLATLALMKEIALALGLVVAALVFFDGLLQKSKEKLGALKRLVQGALPGLACAAAVLVPYFLWSRYIAGLTAANTAQQTIDAGNLPIYQWPIRFIGELFSAQKTDFFSQVTGGMLRQFFTSRGTMLGSGAMLVGLVVALAVLAALLAGKTRHRRRCVVYAIFAPLGFAAYYLLITMSYLYQMRQEQALAFVSYDRYVMPATMGLLLGALVLLGMAIAQAKPKPAALGTGAVLGLCLVMLLRFVQLVPVGYTLLQVHPDEFSERRVFTQHAQRLQQQLAPDGKTFLVISDDIGITFFMYCHDLLPRQVDYSFGGGTLQTRHKQPNGEVLVHQVECEELAQHLMDTGCTTLYISNADAAFKEQYGSLFADGMEAYEAGQAKLYTVQVQAGVVTLVPSLWVE